MSEVSAQLDTKVGSWTSPVPGSAPAGVDARYEANHQTLAGRLSKLESPLADEVDWKAVEAEALAILQTQSKDLLVGSWLTAALYEREGVEGLSSGLWGLSSVIDSYWDDLFPALGRIRARSSALTWLVERIVQRLEDAPTPEHDAANRLFAATERFSSVVRERFGEHAPGVRPLSDSVERIRLSLPPPPEKPASDAQPVDTAPAEAVAAASVSQDAPAQAGAGSTAAPAPQPASPAGSAEASPDASQLLEERVLPILAPIAGEHPAGPDERYHPDHEALRAEIAKLESPTGGDIKWADIIRKGEAFLTLTSKDLLITSYVAHAHFEAEGLSGLSTGLSLVAGIVGGFWEGVHPKRPSARANALRWMLDRVSREFESDKLPKGAKDREVVRRLEVVARVFGNVVREKFGDEAPGLRPLFDGIERLKLSLPKPEEPKPAPIESAQAKPAPAEPSPVQPARAPATSGPPIAAADIPNVDAADPTAFLKAMSSSAGDAASALFRADPAGPLSYRLRRVSLYLSIQASPPANGRSTQIRPPPADLRKQLGALCGNGTWAALLDEAESALGRNRFWLDLHYYVCQALVGLEHQGARDAVMSETAALVLRLPNLGELEFADGSPFAMTDTIQWLGTIGGGTGGGANAGGGSADSDPVLATIKEAKSMAASGKRDEGLRLLSSAAQSAPDGRARFRLRLASARLCASNGAADVAAGIFEGLLDDVGAMTLDAWEPSLAVSALSSFHELLSKNQKADPQRTRDVYRRLCRIDPVAVMVAGKS